MSVAAQGVRASTPVEISDVHESQVGHDTVHRQLGCVATTCTSSLPDVTTDPPFSSMHTSCTDKDDPDKAVDLDDDDEIGLANADVDVDACDADGGPSDETFFARQAAHDKHVRLSIAHALDIRLNSDGTMAESGQSQRTWSPSHDADAHSQHHSQLHGSIQGDDVAASNAHAAHTWHTRSAGNDAVTQHSPPAPSVSNEGLASTHARHRRHVDVFAEDTAACLHAPSEPLCSAILPASADYRDGDCAVNDGTCRRARSAHDASDTGRLRSSTPAAAGGAWEDIDDVIYPLLSSLSHKQLSAQRPSSCAAHRASAPSHHTLLASLSCSTQRCADADTDTAHAARDVAEADTAAAVASACTSTSLSAEPQSTSAVTEAAQTNSVGCDVHSRPCARQTVCGTCCVCELEGWYDVPAMAGSALPNYDSASTVRADSSPPWLKLGGKIEESDTNDNHLATCHTCGACIHDTCAYDAGQKPIVSSSSLTVSTVTRHAPVYCSLHCVPNT